MNKEVFFAPKKDENGPRYYAVSKGMELTLKKISENFTKEQFKKCFPEKIAKEKEGLLDVTFTDAYSIFEKNTKV